VSDPKISPSIHFKWQVPQTVSLQIYISFSPVSSQVLPLQHCIYLLLVSCSPTMTANTNIAFAFYLCLALQQWQQTPTLYLPFTCVLLLLVSCSPTMTANTNIAFTFYLCLALQQWHQTPTLYLPFTCVLLSNNDSKHQHCIYLYHFQAFVPRWTFCPQLGRCHHLAFITLHSQHRIHISIFITLHS